MVFPVEHLRSLSVDLMAAFENSRMDAMAVIWVYTTGRRAEIKDKPACREANLVLYSAAVEEL